MSVKRRKEYTNDDKFDVRLAKASSETLAWVNEQTNLSQSILELIEAHVSQQQMPIWAQIMRDQIINGVRVELRGMSIVATGVVEAPVANSDPVISEASEIEGVEVEIDTSKVEHIAGGMRDWD